MVKYVRGSGGRSIHLAGCRYTKGRPMRPWGWAEGREPGFLAEVAAGLGYRACRACEPFEDDPGGSGVFDLEDGGEL